MISETIIQRSLFDFYVGLGHKLIAPNIHLHYSEADIITVQKSLYVNEIEIKLSKADFKRDFKKRKHTYMAEAVKIDKGQPSRYRKLHTPNYFWFCFPESLLEKIDFDIPDMYGMVLVNDEGKYPKVHKKARIMHRDKATNKQIRQIARSLMFKMWNRPDAY